MNVMPVAVLVISSLPTRGAWIEMLLLGPLLRHLILVAPHTGSVDRNHKVVSTQRTDRIYIGKQTHVGDIYPAGQDLGQRRAATLQKGAQVFHDLSCLCSDVSGDQFIGLCINGQLSGHVNDSPVLHRMLVGAYCLRQCISGKVFLFRHDTIPLSCFLTWI